MKKPGTKGKPAKGKATTAPAINKKPATAPKANKSLKPEPPKPAVKPVKTESASAKAAKTKPAPAALKPAKKSLTTGPSAKAASPAVKDKSSKPAQAATAGAPGKAAKTKSPKAGKTATPNKLVQVIPTHKPSMLSTAPVKKEKMLMRFGKPTKRVLFTVDFLLKASPTIVYHFITTPSALVRWFCDAVDITGEYYTFSWKGNTEVAELIDDIEDERLRFHWLDSEDEDEYFEFRITTADITDETILEIVDFAWADEVEEQKQLWRTQVERLRKETGDA